MEWMLELIHQVIYIYMAESRANNRFVILPVGKMLADSCSEVCCHTPFKKKPSLLLIQIDQESKMKTSRLPCRIVLRTGLFLPDYGVTAVEPARLSEFPPTFSQLNAAAVCRRVPRLSYRLRFWPSHFDWRRCRFRYVAQ